MKSRIQRERRGNVCSWNLSWSGCGEGKNVVFAGGEGVGTGRRGYGGIKGNGKNKIK